ncbi:hypothetical protein COB52_06145, partial [Candidatus Kaiserbacteria bacterium]
MTESETIAQLRWMLIRVEPEYEEFFESLNKKRLVEEKGEHRIWVSLDGEELQLCQKKWKLKVPIDFRVKEVLPSAFKDKDVIPLSRSNDNKYCRVEIRTDAKWKDVVGDLERVHRISKSKGRKNPSLNRLERMCRCFELLTREGLSEDKAIEQYLKEYYEDELRERKKRDERDGIVASIDDDIHIEDVKPKFRKWIKSIKGYFKNEEYNNICY